MDIVPAFGIDGAVPLVAVAVLSIELMKYGVVDGKMQCDDGVAAVVRGEVLDIVPALSIGGVIPFVAVTTLSIKLMENSVVDGEV